MYSLRLSQPHHVRCRHCDRPFADNEEYDVMAVVRAPPGGDAKLEALSCIHSAGCSAQELAQAQALMMSRVQLPSRYDEHIENDAKRFALLNTHHSLLVSTFEEYETSQPGLVLQACALQTLPELPSFFALLPMSEADTPVSKRLLSRSQFAGQFEKVLVYDVSIMEMDASKQLELTSFLSGLETRLAQRPEMKRTESHLWTHLHAEGLEGTQKAMLRLVLRIRASDSVVEPLWQVNRHDFAFVFGDLLTSDSGSVAVPAAHNEAWAVASSQVVELVDADARSLLDAVAQGFDSVRCELTQLQDARLSSTMCASPPSGEPLLVYSTNCQRRNASGEYYWLQSDNSQLWLYACESLVDPVPLILTSDCNSTRNSESAIAGMQQLPTQQLKLRWHSGVPRRAAAAGSAAASRRVPLPPPSRRSNLPHIAL